LAPFAALAGLCLVAACSDDDSSTGGPAAGGSAGLGGSSSGGVRSSDSGGSISAARGGQAGEGSGAAAGGPPSGGAGASGGANQAGGSDAAGAGGDIDGVGARGSEAGAGGDRAGGADAGAGGGSNRACGSTTCAAPLVCVAYRVEGGAVFAPDSDGKCESGRHLEPGGATGRCARDFSYECRSPVGCGDDSLACDCGAATCPSQFPSCREPAASSWLDSTAQLVCELLAP
jgi:hypothetical protein